MNWAQGIVLSVTGINKEERADIQRLIEYCGGSYSPGLSKRCTHLVLPDGDISIMSGSDKLEAALRKQHQWGLKLIRLQWLLDSAKAHIWLLEARYEVKLVPAPSPSPSLGAQPATTEAIAAPVSGQQPQKQDAFQHEQQQQNLQLGVAPSPSPGNVPIKSAFAAFHNPFTPPSANAPGLKGLVQESPNGKKKSPKLNDLLHQLKALKSSSPAVDTTQTNQVGNMNGIAHPVAVLPRQPQESLPSAYRGISDLLAALKTIRASEQPKAVPAAGTTAGTGTERVEYPSVTPSQSVLHPVNLKTYGDSQETQTSAEGMLLYPGSGELNNTLSVDSKQKCTPDDGVYQGPALRSVIGCNLTLQDLDQGQNLGCGYDPETQQSMSLSVSDLVLDSSDFGEGLDVDVGVELETRETQTEQEAGKGLFGSMVVCIDPSLSEYETQRVKEALEEGGAKVVESQGIGLGFGTTHVVCEASFVLKWLSMGLSTLTPQWVLQSNKTGHFQRLVTLSADSTRNLIPNKTQAQQNQQQQGANTNTEDATTSSVPVGMGAKSLSFHEKAPQPPPSPYDGIIDLGGVVFSASPPLGKGISKGLSLSLNLTTALTSTHSLTLVSPGNRASSLIVGPPASLSGALAIDVNSIDVTNGNIRRWLLAELETEEERLAEAVKGAGRMGGITEGGGEHGGALHAGGLVLQTTNPQLMLAEVAWSVGELPTTAKLHQTIGRPTEIENLAVWEVIPDSEDEEERGNSGGKDDECITASQAIINHTLHELGAAQHAVQEAFLEQRVDSDRGKLSAAAGLAMPVVSRINDPSMNNSYKDIDTAGGRCLNHSPNASSSAAFMNRIGPSRPHPPTKTTTNVKQPNRNISKGSHSEVWFVETVYRGRSLAILYPRDARGELGHETQNYILQLHQATAEEIISMVYCYYQEMIPLREQYELLRAFPAGPVAGVLKTAFEQGREVKRLELLGTRCSLEGLTKATRDAAGTVYELRLSS